MHQLFDMECIKICMMVMMVMILNANISFLKKKVKYMIETTLVGNGSGNVHMYL